MVRIISFQFSFFNIQYNSISHAFLNYLKMSGLFCCHEAFQTPAAEMANAGCGDDSFRVRRWQSPQPAFANSAADVLQAAIRHWEIVKIYS